MIFCDGFFIWNRSTILLYLKRYTWSSVVEYLPAPKDRVNLSQRMKGPNGHAVTAILLDRNAGSCQRGCMIMQRTRQALRLLLSKWTCQSNPLRTRAAGYESLITFQISSILSFYAGGGVRPHSSA